MTALPDSTVNAYLRTKVLTASPEQLRLMLLEGAIRFLHQGREGLAAKDYAASFDGFSKCRNIIIELMNSMRPDVDPDLCARVQSLYTFIYQTVVNASLEKDVAQADKAAELLEFERETWVLAMEKLAEEKRGGVVAKVPAAAAQPQAFAAQPERRSLSIQG
jgi:flagellar protein FliS